MEITGKIIQVMDEVGGTSRAGNAWRKREYVLETQETYPKKVCFNFFGDRIDQYPMQVGDLMTVSFDLESREFNGRWYTDVRAWKAEKAGQNPADVPAAADPFGAAPSAMPAGYANATPADISAPAPGESDLPF
ncbi:MAG: DUF3127 domain-containing protein [Bacteroidales bacterium]|nr:DUF3127 domain-containing protein [Bacteroidales bacterium]MBD5377013.1 DUF3127 domain-containing protein [Bacteroides sp.]